MTLKDKLENSTLFIILGFIFSSFLVGVGGSVWILHNTGIKVITQSQYHEIVGPIKLESIATNFAEIPISALPYDTRCELR
jgi:hypothetical protein